MLFLLITEMWVPSYILRPSTLALVGPLAIVHCVVWESQLPAPDEGNSSTGSEFRCSPATLAEVEWGAGESPSSDWLIV